MSDQDNTPTRPLPEDPSAGPTPSDPGPTQPIGTEPVAAGAAAASEPIASHVPFTNVEPTTQPLGAPTVTPRSPRNWSWVAPAAVVLAVAGIAVALAASGVFNSTPSGPLVGTPTPAPSITPTTPTDDDEGTVTEPSEWARSSAVARPVGPARWAR